MAYEKIPISEDYIQSPIYSINKQSQLVTAHILYYLYIHKYDYRCVPVSDPYSIKIPLAGSTTQCQNLKKFGSCSVDSVSFGCFMLYQLYTYIYIWFQHGLDF